MRAEGESWALPIDRASSQPKWIVMANDNGTTPCALIVEDDRISQKLLANVVHEVGLSTQICSNGAEGLFHYLRQPELYSLILLDLMMPEVSGDIFLNVVESLHKRSMLHIKPSVILETAATDETRLSQLAAYHCVYAVCYKPIDRKNLLSLIRQIVSSESDIDAISRI